MEKKCTLGYSTTPCKKIWNNCLDLQMRPIFQFIGLSRRDLPFINPKQQNLRIISGGIGGASWTLWTPKIMYNDYIYFYVMYRTSIMMIIKKSKFTQTWGKFFEIDMYSSKIKNWNCQKVQAVTQNLILCWSWVA